MIDRAAGANCLVAAMGDYAVYRYGISLNKIYDYMLAARPIILAAPVDLNLVNLADAGIGLRNVGACDIADAMARMVELAPDDRAQLGRNAQRYVSRTSRTSHWRCNCLPVLTRSVAGHGCSRGVRM